MLRRSGQSGSVRLVGTKWYGVLAFCLTGNVAPVSKLTVIRLPLQMQKHVRPVLGTMTLPTIKTGVINDWIAQLNRKGLGPKLVHNL